MLRVGQPAPRFEALLDDGSRVNLTDYLGEKNLVLYFYPRDNSAGCTKQACSFRDSYAAVAAYDAVILGVSADSVESHQGFKALHDLNFPIASDPEGDLASMYDVTSSLPRLKPRVTYVIDKQGVIRAAFRHDLAIGRHLSDSLEALAAIQAAASPA